MEDRAQSPTMFNLCGLWENTDKNGKKYLSGNLGNMKIMVFRNTFKTEDKHPDYQVRVTQCSRSAESKPAEPEDSIPF